MNNFAFWGISKKKNLIFAFKSQNRKSFIFSIVLRKCETAKVYENLKFYDYDKKRTIR